MWYDKGMIKKATWAVSKTKPAYQQLNPILRQLPPKKKAKPQAVLIEVRKTVKKKSQAQEMADTLSSKNHKPSNGIGVGY